LDFLSLLTPARPTEEGGTNLWWSREVEAAAVLRRRAMKRHAFSILITERFAYYIKKIVSILRVSFSCHQTARQPIYDLLIYTHGYFIPM
jgi:hypothetical protein